MLDRDGLLGWERQEPGLDSGTKRTTGRSRLVLDLQPKSPSFVDLVSRWHVALRGLDPGPGLLGTCWTVSLLDLEEGSSLLGTQKSPEWKLAQGPALLNPGMDQGQGGGGPESLLPGGLDLDQRCACKKFWRSLGRGGTWGCHYLDWTVQRRRFLQGCLGGPQPGEGPQPWRGPQPGAW